jgi:nicotinate-nucleotide adenylyltransferase
MEMPSSARRVAFFGGSFDPPHLGHLAIAHAARDLLHLDAVLFAPVGAQPLKPGGASAGFDDRVAMTRLAIAGNPGFAISLVDAPKPSGNPNYTLETLLSLRDELAPGHPSQNAELFFLMGADSFLGLRTWHRAAEIPFAAALIVASRPGQALDDLREALPTGLTIQPAPEFDQGDHEQEASDPDRSPDRLGVQSFQVSDSAGKTAPFYLLPDLHVEISASAIRDQVAAASAQPGAGPELLPQAVAAYIREHKLYRDPQVQAHMG